MSKDIAILSSHLETLIEARSVSQNELDPLVAYAIQETQDGRTQETRRVQWEYLLKNEVFKLAMTEGDALKDQETRYFYELKSRLDLVLAFTEHEVTDPAFPFSVLEDLLETQTIASCWHIFSWMEERKERLTTNMVPGKGKALVLLRTLNDLLRRVSKTGSSTMFCGRILNFMSSVYPLGERSGVNLRGDYGPQWEEVKPRKEKVVKSDGEPGARMEEDKPMKPEDKKEEFYQTFWWLQLPFSRPPLFAHLLSLESFKKAVVTVLPVISEATRKDQAKMGSKSVGSLKRKREPVAEDASKDFFSAKFLTSPALLDYELADANFRRQVLFQLLILLQHLLYFTSAEKNRWMTNRNRSLQMDFTLNEADTKWTKETWTKVIDELRATSPNGKVFADTVAIILERENNWIRWKEDLCNPFDKDPLQPSLEEQTAPKRRKMIEPAAPWRYKCGSESLTEIWETGFHTLQDCETVPPLPDIKYYAKQNRLLDARIALRKRQLDQMRPPPPTPVAAEVAAANTTVKNEVPVANATDSAAAAATTETTAPASGAASTQPRPVTPHQPISAPSLIAPTPVSVPAPLHPSLPPRPMASPSPFKPPVGKGSAAGVTSNEAEASSSVPASKAVAPSLPKVDERLAQFSDQKNRLSWLALRRGRTEHLHLFDATIGSGDIQVLLTKIEEEKLKEREKELAKEAERENAKEKTDEKGAAMEVDQSQNVTANQEINGAANQATLTTTTEGSSESQSQSQSQPSAAEVTRRSETETQPSSGTSSAPDDLSTTTKEVQMASQPQAGEENGTDPPGMMDVDS